MGKIAIIFIYLILSNREPEEITDSTINKLFNWHIK